MLPEFVDEYGMLISGSILLISYFFIAIEKLQKSVIALLGASMTLLLGLLPFTGGIHKESGCYIKEVFGYIEFQVIFLLVGMMIIVNIANQSGIFKWIAIKLLKMTKGRPIAVLFTVSAFTAVMSAFLDNVTTIVIMIPITFVISKELDIDPIPFLIAETMASNIGGTATLIGDPPNIIIGTKAGLTFMDFINELAPLITVIFFVSIVVLMFLFRKQLKTTEEKMEYVANLDTKGTITDKKLMVRSILTLFFVIYGFVTHDLSGIPAFVFAMAGASFLLMFKKPKEIYADVEWLTIFFFVGLFIIIGGFEATGGISFLANRLIEVTHGSLEAATMLILWGSGLISGLIDNIPYTATMAPLISELINPSNPHALVSTNGMHSPLWWALSLGACLGGNLTLVGAAANVLVSETATSSGHPISFMRFMKYGILITVISLTMSSAYLYIRYLN